MASAQCLVLSEIPIEPVEAVGPTAIVQGAPCLGLERTLRHHDLGRLAEISKGELDQGLHVIGIRRLPHERVGEAGGRVDLPHHPGEMERISPGRLHLDAVRGSDAGIEVQTRNGEPLRAPPLRKPVGFDEGAKDDRSSGGERTQDLETQS